MCCFLSMAAWGQDSPVEIAVKATYLVKFAAFVEWPATAFESPSGPLNICIVGTPLAGVADQAAVGQAVGQHPLAVRHIAAATRASGCHMLFSAGVPQQSVDQAVEAVRGEPVLTVTDQPPAAAHKGIINFMLQSNHVRFEIDDREAARDGLRISSQLLALAVNQSTR
jgi:hypothetical protein